MTGRPNPVFDPAQYRPELEGVQSNRKSAKAMQKQDGNQGALRKKRDSAQAELRRRLTALGGVRVEYSRKAAAQSQGVRIRRRHADCCGEGKRGAQQGGLSLRVPAPSRKTASPKNRARFRGKHVRIRQPRGVGTTRKRSGDGVENRSVQRTPRCFPQSIPARCHRATATCRPFRFGRSRRG